MVAGWVVGLLYWMDPLANRDFDLWKKDGWDSVSIGRIEEATVEGRGAEVGAVVCGEGTYTPEHQSLIVDLLYVS